jgi:hypothetical protein
MKDALVPKHGGYRNLKSFQLGQLAYGVTVLFCERFVDRRSRTRDQMVQAAARACRTLQRAVRLRAPQERWSSS